MLYNKSIIKKPFELVMIQPTPYCNINCTYCYLSEERRNSKEVMTDDVLRKICEKIFYSDLISTTNQVTFLWHAGEPLSLPIRFYENAIKIINEYKKADIKVYHSVLTNGITLNDEWCDFFKKFDFEVGISVDGPDFLHNENRKSKRGSGTFNLVQKGLDTLKRNNIPPYALSTIHLNTLNYPKEMFEFYQKNNIKRIGFNFEEIIGHNLNSSLNKEDAIEKCKFFIEEFYALYDTDCSLYVREFDNLRYIITKGVDFEEYPLDTITPLSIITIDNKGNFSTFAPELADMHSDYYGDFVFGNVFSDNFEDILKSQKFKSIYEDIKKGNLKCKKECEYFNVCGANLPAHKLTENGTFDSTETLNCKISIQLMSEIILDDILKKIKIRDGFITK